MVARRTLVVVAALFATAFVAGCAQSVSGQGTFAGGTSVPSPTDSPSESPSDSPSPSGSESSPSPSGSGASGDDTNPVCAALDKGAIEELLGTSVTLKKSQSSGCQIRGSNGKSMIVAVFDYLTLTEYKKGQYKSLQIDGHPALSTNSNIIYVSRSADADQNGLLAAYFSGLDADGDQIATAVLSQLLRKYSR